MRKWNGILSLKAFKSTAVKIAASGHGKLRGRETDRGPVPISSQTLLWPTKSGLLPMVHIGESIEHVTLIRPAEIASYST